MGIPGLLIALVACGSKSPPTAAPEATDAPRAETPDLYGPAGLKAMTAKIVPLLEKHAEREFTSPPVVEAFDAEAFRAFAARETGLIMDTVFAETPAPLRRKMAEEQGAIHGLLGKYGMFEHKTYVVPESIERASKNLDLPEADLATVILAHELGHAMQAQVADDETTLRSLADQDQFRCWQVVSEGGANALARRVAIDLGLEEAFWKVATLQGWDRDGMKHPLAYGTWMPYGYGMHLMDDVIEAGGMQAFWRWHRETPGSSAMLFDIDRYSPQVEAGPRDLASVLRGTEQLLTRGEWVIANTRLGEYSLRGAAIRTGKEAEFEPVLHHLVQAQHLDLVMSSPQRSGEIQILEFDSPEAARDYVELLRAEQTVEGQILAKMLGSPVEVFYEPVSGVDGDASLLRTERPVGAMGVTAESRTAWVARGPTVVAVLASGFRPGLRLAHTLNGVFDNLDSAR